MKHFRIVYADNVWIIDAISVKSRKKFEKTPKYQRIPSQGTTGYQRFPASLIVKSVVEVPLLFDQLYVIGICA